MLVRNGVVNPFAKTKTVVNPISSRPENSLPPHTQLRPAFSMSDKIENLPVEKKYEFVSTELCNIEPIIVKEDNNCDLLNINQQILKYFKEIRNRIEHLDKSIPMVVEFINSTKNSSVKMKYQNQLYEIEKEIAGLKKFSSLEYRIKTGPLLKEFMGLRQNMGVSVLGKKKGVNDYHNQTRKVMLVKEFLSYAVRYCTVLKIEKCSGEPTCYKCGEELLDNGQELQCVNCGLVQECIEVGENMDGGSDNKNISKKTGVSDNIKNFRNIIDQFEVSSNVNIPTKIIDSIREHILKYRSFNIDCLTKGDLVTVMKMLKLNSMWFKHLNKIYFILTNKKPETIDPYIPNLMKRIEYFAEIHDEVKGPDRSNFIHGLHIFWIFLMNEGYKPNPDDFVLLKSREVEINNLKIIEKAFNILTVKHPEFEWKIFEFS